MTAPEANVVGDCVSYLNSYIQLTADKQRSVPIDTYFLYPIHTIIPDTMVLLNIFSRLSEFGDYQTDPNHILRRNWVHVQNGWRDRHHCFFYRRNPTNVHWDAAPPNAKWPPLQFDANPTDVDVISVLRNSQAHGRIRFGNFSIDDYFNGFADVIDAEGPVLPAVAADAGLALPASPNYNTPGNYRLFLVDYHPTGTIKRNVRILVVNFGELRNLLFEWIARCLNLSNHDIFNYASTFNTAPALTPTVNLSLTVWKPVITVGVISTAALALLGYVGLRRFGAK